MPPVKDNYRRYESIGTVCRGRTNQGTFNTFVTLREFPIMLEPFLICRRRKLPIVNGTGIREPQMGHIVRINLNQQNVQWARDQYPPDQRCSIKNCDINRIKYAFPVLKFRLRQF